MKGSDSYYPPREEETNEIERQQAQVHDTHVRTRSDDSNRNEVISTQQMSQIVSCEVRLRDQCKGTTCNRYECPAGCLDSKAKVIGSVHYEMQSSICRAAIHYGIIDNEGGWVDITRQGRKHYFIKSNRNGVQTIGKYQSANSFTVSKVTVQAVTCETTVEQLCPFHKPASHCPRVYCPRNCMQANPHYARVIGSRIYSDLSSICRAAVHAGVICMPVSKNVFRKQESSEGDILIRHINYNHTNKKEGRKYHVAGTFQEQQQQQQQQQRSVCFEDIEQMMCYMSQDQSGGTEKPG
uniref:cysteine-rich secretory protein LCCL domain-containing 1 n=1 Tax=Ictidomys tridecemlineatus TaxID=43179 RepID=UPI001A9E6148|nr:cysteine-rich secretory protein LCCL domain-containing 1 [Ictidomys tridecemlineatus]